MKARTLEILKNFSGINKSILIREGNVLRTMNPERTVFANAIVEDNFPREFGVFDLSQLLSAWSLINEPDVSYEEDHILLTKAEGTEIKLFYASPRHIKSAPNKEIALPTTLLSFELKKETLLEMLKASAILKLTNLYVTTSSVICKNPDGTGNEYRCPINEFVISPDLDEEEAEDLQYVIDINAIRLIPDDYDVIVTEIAIRFKSKSGNLEYFVLLNQ